MQLFEGNAASLFYGNNGDDHGDSEMDTTQRILNTICEVERVLQMSDEEILRLHNDDRHHHNEDADKHQHRRHHTTNSNGWFDEQ